MPCGGPKGNSSKDSDYQTNNSNDSSCIILRRPKLGPPVNYSKGRKPYIKK
ncbi:hypothetical protein ABFA07_017949 [Porites harrisoni]